MAYIYDADTPPFGNIDVYELSFYVSNPDQIKGDTRFASESYTWMNWIARLPVNEPESTPGGAVHRERSGDIWDRPSYVLGFININQCQPVHSVDDDDDDGVIYRERYNLMKRSFPSRKLSFVYCNGC